CLSAHHPGGASWRRHDPGDPLMLWLGVYFPLLPLEVFERDTPAGKHAPAEEAEAPMVVTDERGRILLGNAAAAAAGIARRSSLATAHSIIPGLVYYRRHPERERQRLELLAAALYGFSARVSLAPPAGADDPGAGVM